MLSVPHLQVGVFSPSLRSHYLNVTPSNLVHIYSPDSGDRDPLRAPQPIPKVRGQAGRELPGPLGTAQALKATRGRNMGEVAEEGLALGRGDVTHFQGPPGLRLHYDLDWALSPSPTVSSAQVVGGQHEDSAAHTTCPHEHWVQQWSLL